MGHQGIKEDGDLENEKSAVPVEITALEETLGSGDIGFFRECAYMVCSDTLEGTRNVLFRLESGGQN